MRQLDTTIPARAARDGAGVSISRLAGSQLHALLDPFLMIDEINSGDAADYIGGFPEHPHRGFETITYMKTGRMRHRDHMGNEGVIEGGDVQWMTAGAGVLHSEMPEQERGLMHGFQIWLNLPAAEKMKPAAYREITSAEIVEHAVSAHTGVRVIAGHVTVDGTPLCGPGPEISTHPVVLDVTLAPDQSLELAFNPDYPALAYAYSGSTRDIATRHLGAFGAGSHLTLQAGAKGAQLLVLSGRPLNEAIVQYGPFVMNSSEEIHQAISDFQNPQFITALAANRT